jgi:Protein of unknown function (DUF2442)
MFPKLLRVRPLKKYTLWLVYADGTTGALDLSNFVGNGIFKRWEENGFFEKVFVGETGAITWDEQLDICPNNAYLTIRNLSFEDWKNQAQNHYATN